MLPSWLQCQPFGNAVVFVVVTCSYSCRTLLATPEACTLYQQHRKAHHGLHTVISTDRHGMQAAIDYQPSFADTIVGSMYAKCLCTMSTTLAELTNSNDLRSGDARVLCDHASYS